MIDERIVGHMDLLPLDERRYGNHHRELFRLASKVVDHGDDGLVAVPDENDLRRLVEELDVGFGDVEAAKGSDRWTRPQRESAASDAPSSVMERFMRSSFRKMFRLVSPKARATGSGPGSSRFNKGVIGAERTRDQSNPFGWNKTK